MYTKTIYQEVESAIEQGGVKLKNESLPSWEKYILDFLFYISRQERIELIFKSLGRILFIINFGGSDTSVMSSEIYRLIMRN